MPPDGKWFDDLSKNAHLKAAWDNFVAGAIPQAGMLTAAEQAHFFDVDRLLTDVKKNHQYYDIDEGIHLEQFSAEIFSLRRNLAQTFYKQVWDVELLIILQRCKFVDPANGTFELQCEVITGIPILAAVKYLQFTGLTVAEKDLRDCISTENVIWFQNPDVEKRLTALLEVQVPGGDVDRRFRAFNFGYNSENIWLTQNLLVRHYQKASFPDYPSGRFTYCVDFSFGQAQGLVRPKAKNEKATFLPEFNAGEFEHIDTVPAKLKALAFLPNEAFLMEQRMRLTFDLRRKMTPVLLRIGLPLFVMMMLMWIGCWFVNDKAQLANNLIPAIIVAIVALQLTAAQNLPRGARHSRLDLQFVASYLCSVCLLLVVLVLKPDQAPAPGVVDQLAAFFGGGAEAQSGRPSNSGEIISLLVIAGGYILACCLLGFDSLWRIAAGWIGSSSD